MITHLLSTVDSTHTKLHLLLSGDTYRDYCMGKWKGKKALSSLLSFVVIDRPGVVQHVDDDQDSEKEKKMNIVFKTIPELKDISSTMARNTIDMTLLSTILEPSVVEYIQEHELYAFQTNTTKEGE